MSGGLLGQHLTAVPSHGGRERAEEEQTLCPNGGVEKVGSSQRY